MDVQTILWIFGAVITVSGLVLGFLVNWNHRTAERVGKVEQALADFRAEIPVRYAHEGDIQRVERAIELVRTDVNNVAERLTLSMANLAEKVNQLIGQNTK